MIRFVSLITVLIAGLAHAQQQEVSTASGSELRILDKLTGSIEDVSLLNGETARWGYLRVKLNECRYPSANPSGDAYASITINYRDQEEPVFSGWMLASAPALNAMDHPRYDVWPLSCITS